MLEEIEFPADFRRRIKSGELYQLLKGIADATGSTWTLTYDRIANYDGEGEPFVSHEIAKGDIKKRKEPSLQLAIVVTPYESKTDSLENYFTSITFFQPLGFRGGTPSEKDLASLQEYCNEVAEALLQNKIVKIKKV